MTRNSRAARKFRAVGAERAVLMLLVNCPPITAGFFAAAIATATKTALATVTSRSQETTQKSVRNRERTARPSISRYPQGIFHEQQPRVYTRGELSPWTRKRRRWRDSSALYTAINELLRSYQRATLPLSVLNLYLESISTQHATQRPSRSRSRGRRRICEHAACHFATADLL